MFCLSTEYLAQNTLFVTYTLIILAALKSTAEVDTAKFLVYTHDYAEPLPVQNLYAHLHRTSACSKFPFQVILYIIK